MQDVLYQTFLLLTRTKLRPCGYFIFPVKLPTSTTFGKKSLKNERAPLVVSGGAIDFKDLICCLMLAFLSKVC